MLVVVPEASDIRNFFSLKEIVNCMMVDNYDPKLGGATLKDKNDPLYTKKSRRKGKGQRLKMYTTPK